MNFVSVLFVSSEIITRYIMEFSLFICTKRIHSSTIHTIVISHLTPRNMHLCLGHECFYYSSHCHVILIDTLYIYKRIHGMLKFKTIAHHNDLLCQCNLFLIGVYIGRYLNHFTNFLLRRKK